MSSFEPAVVVGAALVGVALAVVIERIAVHVGNRRARSVVRRIERSIRWPLILSFGALSALIAWRALDLGDDGWAGSVRHGIVIVATIAVAWLAAGALLVAEDLTFLRLRTTDADDKRYRRTRTQLGVVRRMTIVVIGFVAAAAVLLSFPTLRPLGASLLASAGIAGIAAGLAAQSVLANGFAGLQLAFTDSLRIGDVVVVEEEWGRVEHLSLTYVVLRLWDERRLVLPTSYFTKEPFENWTRDESRVVGAVALHLDPAAPVDAVRARAQEVVEASALWDRRDWVLQVVDSTETTMVVRILASAADGPSAWDLRCEIREELLRFIAEERPECLPRQRVDAGSPELLPVF